MKEPYKSITKEIYNELIIVLTFSAGISALAKPLALLVSEFIFTITFPEMFLLLICSTFIILTNIKKEHRITIFIKTILTIIGFTLLLIPTITFLYKVAGFNNNFPTYSYFICYIGSIIIYTLKHMFNNEQSK